MNSESLRDIAAKLNFLQEQIILSKISPNHYQADPSDFPLLPVTLNRSSAKQTLIFFMGHNLWKNGYPKSLANTLMSFGDGYNLCLVRDFKNCWYSEGLLGLTKSLDETGSWLVKYLKEKSLSPDMVAGFSSGAYAAIILGVTMGAKRIFAFGAQAYLDKHIISLFSSKNPHTPLATLEKGISGIPLDLSDFLEKIEESPEINLVVGEKSEFDLAHANRLSRFKNVKIHVIPGCSNHQVLGFMLKNGLLTAFLESNV